MPDGRYVNSCRFSSPFIQDTLYHALSSDLVGSHSSILPLHPLDDLADVFAVSNRVDLPALLQRYKDYLVRLKEKEINPWKEQPRRKIDLHLTEAFHLYAWLKDALTDLAVVSPEFPMGNGQVDLHIRYGNQVGLIEVKSFKRTTTLKKDRAQSARYAKSLGLAQVTLAVFVPLEDETVLQQLSVVETVDEVEVTVVAIGWV